jgi:methylthioribose-1-phosphate isomerase
VAAAYGVALEVARGGSSGRARDVLCGARPTALNLFGAADRVATAADPLGEARAIEAEERAASEAIAIHGADRLPTARRVLTHCNTGSLAAPGRGTALAVISELADRGQLELVLVCETRPLLQGARLTTWELARLGIAYELIVDAAAAGLIARGAADAVLVGADRVAANGDVANKVGTYSLALAAREAQIPFLVAAPTSTIDRACPSGSEIEIEERAPAEVLPGGCCRNPAFDITPAELVSALVTERGVVSPALA